MARPYASNRSLTLKCMLIATLASSLSHVHHVKGFSPASPKTSLSLRKASNVTSASPFMTSTSTSGSSSSASSLSNVSPLGAWPLTKNCDPKGVSPDYPLAFNRIFITVASTFVTWYAQKVNNYTNVMASAATTLICSMCFDKRLGQAAFCGSFAGMSSVNVIPTATLALALGGVTSVLFEALIHYRNAYLGVGGRLGATAFLATSIIAALTSVSTGVNVNVNAMSSLSSLSLLLVSPTVVSMALWHAVGSVATIVLREASDDSAAADPVRASAVIGLIGALVLQDKTAALAVYGGSFVGMSLPSRLMHGILPSMKKKMKSAPSVASLLSAFAVAGALGGIVHGLTIELGFWPGGWGGKAGSCAFVGCLIYRAISKISSSMIGDGNEDEKVGLVGN